MSQLHEQNTDRSKVVLLEICMLHLQQDPEGVGGMVSCAKLSQLRTGVHAWSEAPTIAALALRAFISVPANTC